LVAAGRTWPQCRGGGLEIVSAGACVDGADDSFQGNCKRRDIAGTIDSKGGSPAAPGFAGPMGINGGGSMKIRSHGVATGRSISRADNKSAVRLQALTQKDRTSGAGKAPDAGSINGPQSVRANYDPTLLNGGPAHPKVWRQRATKNVQGVIGRD